MTVLSPCDATQARLAFMAAVEQCKGPVYLRFGREAMPDFTSPEMGFEVGKAQVLRKGNDVTIMATGHMVWEALQATTALEAEGINARVINIHTIKPVDKEAIIMAAMETGAIVTAEEHQVSTGLGSAIAEVVVQHHPVPMAFVGMPDCFGESGAPRELMAKFGLTAGRICEKVREVIGRKLNLEP